MHNLFFHCWILVQRKVKVMLEYHETVIFKQKTHKLFIGPV